MKTKVKQEYFSKSEKELGEIILSTKKDIIKLMQERWTKPAHNTHTAKALRNSIAVAKTALRQKQIEQEEKE